MGTNSIVFPWTLMASYDWLLHSNNATLVNESWEIGAGFTFRSMLTDWYARNAGMTFVQSSGNIAEEKLDLGCESPSDCEVVCAGFNSICVGASRWPLIPGANPRDTTEFRMAQFSKWVNPYPDSRPEIEKPDLVADGSLSHVASCIGDRYWDTDYGTSLAAPLVTGVLAAARSYCQTSSSVGPLIERALLRTYYTWKPNRIESSSSSYNWAPTCPAINPPPAFPSAWLGCDYKGGAGPIYAGTPVPEYCDDNIPSDQQPPPGPGSGDPSTACVEQPCFGSATGVISGSGEDIPSELQAQHTDEDTTSNSTHFPLRSGDGMTANVIYEWPNGAQKGLRVRAALAYNSCPLSNTDAGDYLARKIYDVSDLAPANNLDFGLCGISKDTGGFKCAATSESLDDTNEGFDVILDSDYAWLKFYVFRPAEIKECPSDIAPRPEEPFAFRVIFGRP